MGSPIHTSKSYKFKMEQNNSPELQNILFPSGSNDGNGTCEVAGGFSRGLRCFTKSIPNVAVVITEIGSRHTVEASLLWIHTLAENCSSLLFTGFAFA